MADGCIISNANIERAVIGIRGIIESGATIRNFVVMGNDLYQDESLWKPGDQSIGTGRNAVIEAPSSVKMRGSETSS